MAFDVEVALTRPGAARIAASFRSDAGATVLFGPSGAGKTSVLSMIAGLVRPDAGHVRVAGRTLFDAAARIDLPPERRGAGYVFQETRLFPHLTVRRNLLYGARRGPSPVRPQPVERPLFARVAGKNGASTSSARTEEWSLAETAAMLDIGHLLDRWPRSLSGGEARRVAIGRALLSDPAFLLLDEPTASLDARRAEEVLRVVVRLRDEERLPILMVTHDRTEAERVGAERVGAMVEILGEAAVTA